MIELLTAVGIAFGVVFVAELGDKTQLLALNFGARYSLRTVAVGLMLGYAAAGAVATVVGGFLGSAFPDRPISIVGGVLFLAFALMTWRDGDGNDDGDGDGDVATTPGRRSSRGSSVIASIALTIAVAEMGDKTQLATATLAARSDALGTWIGATTGEVAAGMIGAFAGSRLGSSVPARTLRIVSAATFALFGVLMLASAV